MVWDSYEQQLYENGSQETVYFADLDSMTEQYDGLYCLNAQERAAYCAKGTSAYDRKAERKSFRRAVRPIGQQNPCTAGGIRRKNQCARPEFQKWNERQWT